MDATCSTRCGDATVRNLDERTGALVARLDRLEGATAVVCAAGEVDYHTAALLRDVVDGALRAGAQALVIDLSEVTFLDAAGLGVAVATARTVGAERTAIVCHDALARLFRITALDRALTIRATQTQALQALGAATAGAGRWRTYSSGVPIASSLR